MKIIILNIVAIIALILLGLQAAEVPNDDQFFPILAWHERPWNEDVNFFREMKECNFTLAGFVAPEQLDAVAAAGLKAYLKTDAISSLNWQNPDSENMKKKFTALHEQVGAHPALFGYYLKDEPREVTEFKGLGAMAAIIREAAPDKEIYINLLPGDCSNIFYLHYVSEYFRAVPANMLSFDRYPYDEFTGAEGQRKVGMPGRDFWENMELMRRQSLEHNVPFYFIGQCVVWGDRMTPEHRMLNFQAFSAIAYNAKGIGWFVYKNPTWWSGWRAAPIDQYGEKTPTWDALRMVNRDILALAPVINHLKSDGVYHFGKDLDYGKPGEDALVQELPPGEFLVGDFTHDQTGERYLMIVNKDLNNVAPRGDYWNSWVKFRKQPKQVYHQVPWQKQEIVWGGQMQPGEAALLRMDY